MADALNALSIRELRAQCTKKGVRTEGLLEKQELVDALLSASTEEPMDMDGSEAEDDEEALLAQAMLMSQESEENLGSLPVRELRKRAQERGIDTRGLAEKADLVAVLLGASDAPPDAPPVTASNVSARDETVPPGVEVLARFPVRFACFTTQDLGMGSALEQTGKVLLPRSCLMAFAFLGELPATMLLRMTFHERSVHVGVADFVDDEAALDATSAHGHSTPVWGPGRRSVAAVFVPRWVRSQLACANGDELSLSLVSLPKASGVTLTPHTDAFATALACCADPRAVLTEIVNRYVAISVGDVIHLAMPGSSEGGSGIEGGGGGGEETMRHALDVTSLRGLPGVRCGLPEGAPQTLDVGAALRELLPEAGSGAAGAVKGVKVRAACLVDADVECDFAESLETAGREARAAQAQAQAAAQAAAAREEAAALAAAQQQQAARAAEQAAAEREVRRAAAVAALAAMSPPASSEPAVTVAVRCPDGTRLVRRFSPQHAVLGGFLLVEAEWREPADSPPLPADFALATRAPRHCLRRSDAAAEGTTFEGAGLTSAQEALFVETGSTSA